MGFEEEHGFEIEKVSPMWLVLALVGVPFALYYFLNFLSPFVYRLTAMRITELYVYPIKSLRGVKVSEAIGTKFGFQHDRSFMLLQVTPEGYKNMAVSNYPEMTQFLQEIDGYGTDNGTLTITYRAYGDAEKAKTIKIPLMPGLDKLEPLEITMHGSSTPALKMPSAYSAWFTSCFGYDVLLVYIGDNKRAVLFENMQPLDTPPLTRFLQKTIPFADAYVDKTTRLHQPESWKIGFADCAPYLVVSQTSLENISARLPDGEEMDVTKFRPNIVIKGAFEAFQEDYWGTLKINRKAELVCAHNCVRCKSVNVDYETGKPGTGAAGEVLKRMQKDRRIDVGAKWSPVFGRYGFWDPKWAVQMVRVGDQVNVKEMNEGYTVWSWPSLG